MKNDLSHLLLGIVTACVLFGAFTGVVSGKTWYVDDNGPADFASISDAVNNASAGDTVIVRDGTYYGNVNISKQLTVKSASGPIGCIVDGMGKGDVITLSANGINFEGFTVRNSGSSSNNAGIKVLSSYNNITSNTVDSNGHDGIDLYYSTGNTLTGNTANSNGNYGISLYSSNGNTLTSNTANSNGIYGICLSSSNGNILTNNMANSNKNYGIYLSSSSSNKLIDNAANSNYNIGIYLVSSNGNMLTGNIANSNNGEGIDYKLTEIFQFGIYLDFSNGNILIDNTANSNLDYGIYLTSSSSNTLTGNTANSNLDYGIYLTSSSSNTLTGNTAKSNGKYGIYLSSSSSNKIYFNNFINGKNVYSDSTNTWNSISKIPYVYNSSVYTNYLGNYWSDYTGRDANGDGIGDTSYSIGSDADNYPLMTPIGNYSSPPQQDTTPPASVTNLRNTTYNQNSITWVWTDPADSDFARVMVYLNGAFQANVNKGVQTWTATGLTAGTAYTIGTRTVDNSGNVNTNWVNHTAYTAPPPILPVANFTANQTSGYAPLHVLFTDTSTGNPDAWSWDFGDGNTSSGQNVTHVYDYAGIYNVTLSVTNDYGSNSIIRQGYIHVVSEPEPCTMPVANFTTNQTSGYAPLHVLFTDTSTGNPHDWSWNFGDGNTSSGQNVTYVYAYAGTFNVSLTVTNDCGSDSITKQEYVHVSPPCTPPVANFTINNGAFTDTSTGNPNKWYWDFGDNATSTVQNPTHVYAHAGTYNVTLTVTNDCGSDSITKQYTVPSPIPVPNFEGKPVSGKAPLNVSFTDTSTGTITTRFWDFGDGTTEWANATRTISHSYLIPGTYTVSLTVGNSGGEETLTRNAYIQVNPSGTTPFALFAASPMMGYAPLTVQFTDRSIGKPLKWQWDFGDGNTSSEQNPTHTYYSVGKYSPTLKVFNSGGSSTYSSLVWVRSPFVFSTITIPPTPTIPSFPTFTIPPTPTTRPTLPPQPGQPPIAFFKMNTSFGRAPLTVQFTDLSFNSPTNWTWDFGDGHTSTERNPVNTYTKSGTYTVSLTVKNAMGQSATSRPIIVR